MKQFSIQALFGFMTLAAVVCGIIHWFGFNGYVFSFCVCLIGGPLVGSIIGIRSSESINLPSNTFRGGGFGGIAGYLAFSLSLAPTMGFFPFPLVIWLSIGVSWLFGLATVFTFGIMVGFAIALGWTLTTVLKKRRNQ